MLARLVTSVLPLAALAATLIAWWNAPPPLASGVVGRYYANGAWSGPPIVERVETEISTDTLASHPELGTLPVFTAEWTGFLIVREPHVFRFATKSDDGSWLWIDDRLVVDNGGVHGPQNVMGEQYLDAGVHSFRVRYLEAGGGFTLQLGQSAAGGHMQNPGPLLPHAVTYGEVRRRELWPLALVALWYVTLLGLAAVALGRWSHAAGGQLALAAVRDRWFLAIAAAGLALVVAHIDYGLGPYESYSLDELMPLPVIDASRNLFLGWNLRWPPGHPAAIALLLQPFVWAGALFDLPLTDPAVASLMLLVMRAFSVLLLWLTLALVFDIAAELSDRTSAACAVALLSLAPVIVYFGSFANLEIPHLFWVTASWWAWLRFVRHRDVAASVVFGAAVGLSLAVKDQAYGYYLAAPVAAWLVLRDVRDRRFIAIGLATLAAFAIGHGLPWAWERLPDHVAHMRQVSRPFQMYPRSPAGQIELQLATLRAFIWAAGTPLAAAFVGGVVEEVWAGRGRRLAALLTPALTYYAGFLIVIAYVYDRFLIAILPMAAVVGGRFLRSLLSARALPAAARYGIPALLLGVGLLNAVAQNVVFRADARDRAAAWMAESLPCGASVGVTFDTAYVPSLGCYDVWPFLPSQTAQAARWPEYFVLSETYAQRFLTTDAGGAFIRRLVTGELGYRLAFRAEARPPWWAPLYWEQRFRNGREDPDTSLDKPINAIEVWQLTTARP